MSYCVLLSLDSDPDVPVFRVLLFLDSDPDVTVFRVLLSLHSDPRPVRCYPLHLPIPRVSENQNSFLCDCSLSDGATNHGGVTCPVYSVRPVGVTECPRGSGVSKWGL